MFIAHFGIGFGAKKFAPAISLGALFIASQFLDLLWPSLLLLDLEHVRIAPGITRVTPLDFFHYPFSHSLIMVIAWGVFLGLLTHIFLRNLRYALVIFFCVLSHWFLDLLVHRPDLPLYPGGSLLLGFGLWNFPLWTIVLEVFFFLGGVWFYTKTTSPVNKFGNYGLIGLVLFLLLIQFANMAGPPPDNVSLIAWAGQLQWLFVVFAFFVDKNRSLVQQGTPDAKITFRRTPGQQAAK